MQRIKNFFANMKGKALALRAMAVCTMAMMMTPSVSAITVNTGLDPSNILSSIADWMLSTLSAIGLVFIIWGGFQFGMSFKDEDAASKQRGILVLVAGVIMVGLKAVLHQFGIIAA